MAYVFRRGKMMSGVADVALTNAVSTEKVPNGALVVIKDLAEDKTYADDGLEFDLYKAEKPAAATDEVAIVDYAGISEGIIAGNDYKLGNKLYDLEVPAGNLMRVRRLYLHDKFWLGDGNFSAEPTVGKYAVAQANNYKHAPADTLPTAGYAIKIIYKEDLTAGMASKGKLYLCEVVKL